MKIPPYPKSRPLALSDKSLFDRLCYEIQPRISELTFAGLYLFRNAHDYALTSVGDSVVVLGKGYDGLQYIMPPMGGDIAATLNTVFADGLSLYGADEIFVNKYLKNCTFQLSESRDSFDYLYLREELALLPGGRYHKKKNRITYFASRHTYTVALFSSIYRNGCLNLLDSWLKNS